MINNAKQIIVDFVNKTKFTIFLMVDIQSNPLYYAAIGGLIIGIATSINYVLRGSVTGMSGMLYSTVTLDKQQMPKNIAIIGGMLLSSGIFFDIFQYGTYNQFTPFGPQSDITIYTSQLGFALAGVLVGFGTKLSNGCTSGHGLCGLARFSIRSLVAVLTFMFAAMSIATIIYYANGLGPFTQQRYSPSITYDHMITSNISIVFGVLLVLLGLYIRISSAKSLLQEMETEKTNTLHHHHHQGKHAQTIHTSQYIVKDQLVLFLVGLIFGAGLLVAGMVRRSNIIMFLALGKDWNPSLMFVLGCGLAVNLVSFTYMLKVKKISLFGEKLFNPSNNVLDWRLTGGAVCFGLGWGIGGLCPGPTIMQSSVFTIDVHLIWLPFFFLGQFMANKINEVIHEHESHAKKHHQKVEQGQKHHQKLHNQKSTSNAIRQNQTLHIKPNVNTLPPIKMGHGYHEHQHNTLVNEMDVTAKLKLENDFVNGEISSHMDPMLQKQKSFEISELH